MPVSIKLPHWVLALSLLLIAEAPKVSAAFPTQPIVQSVCGIVVQVAGAIGFLAGAGSGSMFSAKAAASGTAGMLGLMRTLVVLVVLLAVGLSLTGCMSSTPVVPVTPENQAQVSACETAALEHNAFALGDYVFTGGALAAGAVAAALPSDNASGRTDLAVTAAASAGIAGILTGLSRMTTSQFSAQRCVDVVGPLPSTPFGTKGPQS